MRQPRISYRCLSVILVASNVAVVIYFAILQHTDFQNRDSASQIRSQASNPREVSVPLVTILIRDFEHFENEIVKTIRSIQWNKRVEIVVVSDEPIYPPLRIAPLESGVKFVSLKIDPRNSLQDIRPEQFMNGEYVLFVPDSTNLSQLSTLSAAVEYLNSRKDITALAIGEAESHKLECYSLAADLRRWSLRISHSNHSESCDFVDERHSLLVKRVNFLQLADPFLQPFLLSFYIQASLRHWKTAIYPQRLFSSLMTLYQDPHSRWKRKQLVEERKKTLYEAVGFKLVVRANGQEEWYGCRKDTARCFGTVVNDVPDFIYQDRWTPSCCLRALRETARHVFKTLEDCKVRYWLEGGSLLGAARTGDVIPWDYDVDVGVYRQDLLLCSPLVSAMTEPFVDSLGFVWEKAHEGAFYRVQYSESNHMHVDIFPFYSRNGTMTKDTWMKTHRQDMEFPEHFLKPLTRLSFVGFQASAPNHVKQFLELKFGAGVVDNPRYPNGHSPKNGTGDFSMYGL